jgi:hypothetical protein
MWFKQLCGFEEESPAQVREQLMIRGNKLISRVNQREFTYGVSFPLFRAIQK